jgi:predicted AlkP superfamily phosphohydrolase/phosphomutase
MKVLVIGLDCASPELVFDKFQDSLPNLTRLRANGIYGNLKSCIPAITIPAWMVMMTGKSPGKLGLYGLPTLGKLARRLSGIFSNKPTRNRAWSVCLPLILPSRSMVTLSPVS